MAQHFMGLKILQHSWFGDSSLSVQGQRCGQAKGFAYDFAVPYDRRSEK